MTWKEILKRDDDELLEHWEAQAFEGELHPADYIPALDDFAGQMPVWAKQHGLTRDSSNREIAEAVKKSYIADPTRHNIDVPYGQRNREQYESGEEMAMNTITWKEFFEKGGHIDIMGGYDSLYDVVRMSLEDPMPLNDDGEEMSGANDVEDYLDYRKRQGA